MYSQAQQLRYIFCDRRDFLLNYDVPPCTGLFFHVNDSVVNFQLLNLSYYLHTKAFGTIGGVDGELMVIETLFFLLLRK